MDCLTVLILAAGFLGFYTLFIETRPAVKFLAIAAFIHCFFSYTPLTSFTSYIPLVGCLYFYIFLSRVKNWNRVFGFALIFLFLNIIFMVTQYLHKDVLLNFNVGKNIGFFGLTGSRMQLESYLIVTLALLISKSGWHRKLLIPVAMISILIFIFTFGYTSLTGHLSSRLPAWYHTIKLANQHPFIGWGMASFKDLFMPLSGFHDGQWQWKMAHNDYLQIAFEFGYIGLAIFIGFLIRLGQQLRKLRKRKLFRQRAQFCFLGLMIICADMCVHFPLREWQTVLTIIIFLAYCEKETRRWVMPWHVEKRSGKRPYKIVKTSTHEVVGSSASMAAAKASIRARFAGEGKK
jgi:O-antigen ligase